MRHIVKKYIKNCLNCIYYKNKGGPKEGELYPLPKYAQPFHTLHVDRLFCDTSHRFFIDQLYSDIVQALSESSKIGRKNKKYLKKTVGWNKYVAEAHRKARQKFHLWEWYGKPITGKVFEEMIETRKFFKSRLKSFESFASTLFVI